MALTSDEQDLFDEARSVLPHWYFSRERANEELGEFAKLVGASLTQVKDWLQQQVKITLAGGPTSTTPDWLNQHALDRGTQRQGSEPDAVLRDRLRKFEDGIIRRVLLDAVQAILDSYGISGTPYLVELPRDGIFFGTVTADTGTGGVFTAPSGGVMTFTPTVRFKMPPFIPAQSPHDINGGTTGPFTLRNGRVRKYQITIASATNAGNDGTFETTGLVGDAVQYTNVTGAAGTDTAPTWTIKRKDWQDVVLDGFRHSFLSRGDRIGRTGGGEIVVVLPYHSTLATAQAAQRSVAEMLRQKRGAGVTVIVERRASP